MAKHPLVRLMPLANVEVADVPVTFKYGVLSPLYMVEVAPATKLAELLMEKRVPGVVVPMPTLPALLMVSAAGEDVAYASVLVPI